MSLEIYGLDLRLAKKMLFTGVNLRIDKPNLVVYVIDEAGLFIEGAAVNILSSGHELNSVSDAFGTALTRFMPAINNTLTVSKDGYAISTQIIYNETPSTLSVYVQLYASEIRLKVVNNQNEPIEGATCRVLNAIVASNNVISLDTVDDYLRVAGSGLPIAANANFVFEMYLKVASWSGGNPGLWRAGTGSNGTSFNIFNGSTGRPWIRWNGTDVLKPTSGYQLPTGEWHKIKYEVISGVSASFYVDDELKHTANHTKATAAIDIYNFGYQNAIGERVAGQYSNIQIKENGTTKMKWPIDEGEGTTLVDESGNGYTGTVFGATWQEADESFPLFDDSIQGYDPTPHDSQTTNANGLTTLNYQINTIHGLEVTLPGKRRFIMPFQRTTRGFLDWQVMLNDYLPPFATNRGTILINSAPE